MTNINKGFFAYSNEPESVGETIENAILKINEIGKLNLKSWKRMDISGKLIIDEICDEIDACDIFLCEISNLNNNVLFELGYASAKQKKIFIFINETISGVKESFDRFGLLKSTGYVTYSNSDHMKNSIISSYEVKDNNYFEEILNNSRIENTSKTIFYMKTPIETEASIALSQFISNQKTNIIVDDPLEVSQQSISWYIEKLLNSNGALFHLMSENYLEYKNHNAKISFISGLAYGIDLPSQILVGSPYSSPIDFKEKILIYRSAQQCKQFAQDWYHVHEKVFLENKSNAIFTINQMKALNDLQKIDLGDNVTENEMDSIFNYYVKTYSYDEALRRNNCIFIGRKGSGKTANLVNIANDLELNKQNHVCIIKPVAYEIEGILQVLNTNISRAESGYLIESIWKYLIYTELAKSIYFVIIKQSVNYLKNDCELELIEFVEMNREIILPEFSVRLDHVVRQLQTLNNHDSNGIEAHQIKVSELIHDTIIKKLRTIVGNYCSKKKKVTVLIDNLDKAWSIGADIEMLSRFIFGLLDVGHLIIQDFSREDHWRQPVNLALIIFLREDIYSQMAQFVPERDKLTVQKIIWEDPEILLRVIEERFSENNSIDIWNKFFCEFVNGIEVKKFLIDNVIPRPRDIITLVKAALNKAISRKHLKIEQEDIYDALETYSGFAFETLISEIGPQHKGIREFLYEFSGRNAVVTRDDIIAAIKNADFLIDDVDNIIKIMCKLSFLGMEIFENDFRFIYNEDDFNKYNILARRVVEKKNSAEQQYKIHKAFCVTLSII